MESGLRVTGGEEVVVFRLCGSLTMPGLAKKDKGQGSWVHPDSQTDKDGDRGEVLVSSHLDGQR